MPEQPTARQNADWQRLWVHRPALISLASARLGPDDAEDVADEALIRGLAAEGIPDHALRSWLLTTTRRLCVDRVREESSQRRRGVLLASQRDSLQTDGPEDDVVERAEGEWLRTRVDHLPGRQAEAVRLRAQGLSIQETATFMGLPPKAVESLLGRARRVLKAAAAAAAVSLVVIRWVAWRKAQIHLVVAGATVTAGLVMGCLDLAGDVGGDPSGTPPQVVSVTPIPGGGLAPVVRAVPPGR